LVEKSREHTLDLKLGKKMENFSVITIFIKIQDFPKNSNFDKSFKNFYKKIVISQKLNSSYFKGNLNFYDQFEILSVSAISGDIKGSRRAPTLKFYKNVDFTKIYRIKYKGMISLL